MDTRPRWQESTTGSSNDTTKRHRGLQESGWFALGDKRLERAGQTPEDSVALPVAVLNGDRCRNPTHILSRSQGNEMQHPQHERLDDRERDFRSMLEPINVTGAGDLWLRLQAGDAFVFCIRATRGTKTSAGDHGGTYDIAVYNSAPGTNATIRRERVAHRD